MRLSPGKNGLDSLFEEVREPGKMASPDRFHLLIAIVCQRYEWFAAISVPCH